MEKDAGARGHRGFGQIHPRGDDLDRRDQRVEVGLQVAARRAAGFAVERPRRRSDRQRQRGGAEIRRRAAFGHDHRAGAGDRLQHRQVEALRTVGGDIGIGGAIELPQRLALERAPDDADGGGRVRLEQRGAARRGLGDDLLHAHAVEAREVLQHQPHPAPARAQHGEGFQQAVDALVPEGAAHVGHQHLVLGDAEPRTHGSAVRIRYRAEGGGIDRVRHQVDARRVDPVLHDPVARPSGRRHHHAVAAREGGGVGRDQRLRAEPHLRDDVGDPAAPVLLPPGMEGPGAAIDGIDRPVGRGEAGDQRGIGLGEAGRVLLRVPVGGKPLVLVEEGDAGHTGQRQDLELFHQCVGVADVAPPPARSTAASSHPFWMRLPLL